MSMVFKGLIGMLQFFLEIITGPASLDQKNHLLPSGIPFLGSMARGIIYEVIMGN